MTTAIERLQTALDTLRLKAVEARLESLLEQASKKEAPLRPRPRKRLSEVQGWGNFDRNYGEFSTGIDRAHPTGQGKASGCTPRQAYRQWCDSTAPAYRHTGRPTALEAYRTRRPTVHRQA